MHERTSFLRAEPDWLGRLLATARLLDVVLQTAGIIVGAGGTETCRRVLKSVDRHRQGCADGSTSALSQLPVQVIGAAGAGAFSWVGTGQSGGDVGGGEAAPGQCAGDDHPADLDEEAAGEEGDVDLVA